jgi:glycylpeptide N-tetradecanoyltransferase
MSNKFWPSQPVYVGTDVEVKPIGVYPIETLAKDPQQLPPGFEWSDIDILNDSVADELYNFLHAHYASNNDGSFRLDYPLEMIRFMLCPPNYEKSWHISIRFNNKIVAFISGTPITIKLHHTNPVRLAEINFLCIAPNLRDKHLSPVLINEVTRRIKLKGYTGAVYTGGIKLSHAMTSCKIYHRPLQVKKLIDTKFLPTPKLTLKSALKLYEITTTCSGIENIPFRKLQKKDVPRYCKALNSYLSKFELTTSFSTEEFIWWFLDNKYIHSFVKANDNDTSFMSFYELPSSVSGNDKHTEIKTAYAYYNMGSKLTNLKQLMQYALEIAKHMKFDVFNALDIMDNDEFINDLKFKPGGPLQYYVYNWYCKPCKPKDIGLVLM